MEKVIHLSKTEFFDCRKILSTMIITCFMIHYMLRINISIAIVEMTETLNKSNSSTYIQWDESQKTQVLGCFYWGFLISAIPGGRLSELYGTKTVLGGAMLISSILTILTPLAAYTGYYCIVLDRILLGVALGVSWPSIPPLAMKWVAPEDTAKFMSHTIACTLGAGIALSFAGYLIFYLGWPSVFYTTEILSFLWTVFWFYLVYDSPQQHPRISKTERELLEAITKKTSLFKKDSTPWLQILLSLPVWAFIVAEFCVQFNTSLILNQLPSYLDQVLSYNIRENGLLSSLPFFVTYFMAVAFSYVADKWIKYEKFSTLTIRKLFTAITFCVPAALYLIQIFWGYSRTVSILVFTLSRGFQAAGAAGIIPNSMDISPVFSGTILGIAMMIASFSGYLSSAAVAFATRDEVSFNQWKLVFWTLILVNIIGCAFFCKFASASAQNWNFTEKNALELVHLKKIKM